MKKTFVPKKFNPEWMYITNKANEILESYAAMSIMPTLRTLYYRFIAMDLFPKSWIDDAYNKKHKLSKGTKNTEKNYKRLGSIIAAARLAGLIDWEHLEDRVRNLIGVKHYANEKSALSELIAQYKIDMWENQRFRPEVWAEKDAVLGNIEPVCIEHDIPFFICRGYTSLSEIYRAAERFQYYETQRQTPYVIHFGDHDPSGIDMSRDIESRITETFGARCMLRRVALNMDQIEKYQPPPNPAKVTDSRFESYRESFGDDSWELDALEPQLFRGLILEHIDVIKDEKIWADDLKRQQDSIKKLEAVKNEWDQKKKPVKKKSIPKRKKPKGK